MQYYSIDTQKTLEHINSRKTGLTQREVDERRGKGVVNKIEEAKKTSMVAKFFAQFKDLMVIILIVSAVISITMAIVSKNYGDLFEGGIIIFIVILNAVLGLVQENKAENALES